MNEPKEPAFCSPVSLIDFQMTVANLSVAEYALREEPYERLPCLAGTIAVAQMQMESLRQEAIELKKSAVSPRSIAGYVPTPVIAQCDCTVRLHFDSPDEADEAFDKLVEWYGKTSDGLTGQQCEE